jgi:hypothetical protein
LGEHSRHEIADHLLPLLTFGSRRKEVGAVLFVGDDWAEDHHDVEIEIGRVAGWLNVGCPRGSKGWPGCMR